MNTVLLAAACAVAYLIAYHTYGRFLAKKIFCLHSPRRTPAYTHQDGMDYVPTKKEILFGHHYTSIAGTGPIVGPAIGIIYGWVPAILWVVFGSILMGAVHDFGAVVVSMRNQGKSIGDVAATLINRRVRIVFLLIIALLLAIVLAIFCLVIAKLFDMYPASVLSVWLQIPIAIWLGHMVYKRGKPSLPYSLIGLVLLYAAIWMGTQMPISLEGFNFAFELGGRGVWLQGAAALWTILLLVYVYFASILPVTTLLQPRDYINGHQLFVVMGALAAAVCIAQPVIVAPVVQWAPTGAPPMWPFLFVLIACGAISGFHSLVASGTTSKQIGDEGHAKMIGYGAMLMEGMLAVLVIIAVAAGFGLLSKDGSTYLSVADGQAAWQTHYATFDSAKGLGDKVGAFVQGSANILHAGLTIPQGLALAIMGVFVASFAGTTLDTATRLQRYVITELAGGLRLKPLTNRYVATAIAVGTGGALALYDGKGAGGMLLYPLFGAGNQLLAGLALLVITVYLAKKGKPIRYTFIPLVFMVVMTGWAMYYNIMSYIAKGEAARHLLIIGSAVVALEIWMIIEAVAVLLRTIKGGPAPEPAAPPVEEGAAPAIDILDGPLVRDEPAVEEPEPAPDAPDAMLFLDGPPALDETPALDEPIDAALPEEEAEPAIDEADIPAEEELIDEAPEIEAPVDAVEPLLAEFDEGLEEEGDAPADEADAALPDESQEPVTDQPGEDLGLEEEPLEPEAGEAPDEESDRSQDEADDAERP